LPDPLSKTAQRRAVPYATAAWKPVDPQTMLWTGFGLEDWGPDTTAAARWRFVDNELLDRDFAKYHDLACRRMPVSTLHRETHGEPDRSPRYRKLHRTMGFGAEMRSVFRADGSPWGVVTLVRAEEQPDFSDQEVAFAARISAHLGHGLREALLREAAAAGPPDRAPGVIVLGADGMVRSLTRQAQFWLEQFPADRGTGLQLPAAGTRSPSGRWPRPARNWPSRPTPACGWPPASGSPCTRHRCAPTAPVPAPVRARSPSPSPRPAPPNWSRCGWRCTA
jgi:GAF domain